MARLGYSGASYYPDDSDNQKQKEELKQLINKAMLQKQLDDMLQQKAGLTKVSSGSYKNLTSLPIEDLKAQLVGQAQNNNTPVVQQDIKQQLSKQQVPVQQNVSQQPVVNNNEDLMSTRPELFSSDRIWQAARQSRGSDLSGEGFAAGYNQNYSGSGYQGDPSDAIGSSEQRAKITEWYKGYLAQHPELVNSVNPETKANQILADRLENHYGGSQYTEDQIKAASEIQAAQLKAKTEQQKIDNEFKMQELKNQGLIEAAKAKGNGGGKTLPASQAKSISGLASVVSQLEGFEQRYSDPKLSGIFGISGRLSRFANSATQADPTLNQYNQDIGMLKRLIAKEIEGGRMSDQDRQYYDKTLFNPNATQESFSNALNYYKAQKESEYNQYLDTYQKAGYDMSGLMDTVGNAQQNIESASGIKKFELNGESYEIPSDDSEAIQEILAAGGKQLE